MHVDVIAGWHRAHAEALPAVLRTLADEHVAAARRDIRARLWERKAEMVKSLHRVAVEGVVACGTLAEQAEDRGRVTCLREAIGDAEADNLSRMADLPRVYRLVHELSVAEERYWSAVARQRSTCVADIQRRLSGALGDLDREFEEILRRDAKRVSKLRLRWFGCRYEVRRRLNDVRRHIEEVKQCKSPWHGGCDAPNPEVHMGKSPLLKCLAILTSLPASVAEAVGEGEKQLTSHYHGLLDGVRGPAESRGGDGERDCKGSREVGASNRSSGRVGNQEVSE